MLFFYILSLSIWSGASYNVLARNEEPAGGSILSQSQIDAFDKDGYIVVRGLLKGKVLDSAIRDAKKILKKPSPFDEITKGVYSKINFNDLQSSKGLQDVALKSDVSTIMGQLMRGVKEIRVLKDATLAFQPKSKGCGWHVDDASFWPCPLETPGHEGVNVWIALSDYKKSHGGGLAIAPTSHRADWMKAARDVIRTPLKPGQHANTCGLEMASPEYHNKCEQLRTTLDMAPGDAIIHSRWLFHRSDDFTAEGEKHFNEGEGSPLMRYSIRYMPAEAVMNNPQEPAAQCEPDLLNQPLYKGGAWFPRAYPSALPQEVRQLSSLGKKTDEKNEALRKMLEMRAKQQSQQPEL